MLSEQEYVSLITKDRPLTKEEQAKIVQFETFIARSITHKEDITSPKVNAITHDYEEQMAFLQSLGNDNPNTQQAINNYHETLNKEEQKIIKFDAALTRTKKINQGFDTRAGFTNASIIIFLVLLLGILLSVGLLVIA